MLRHLVIALLLLIGPGLSAAEFSCSLVSKQPATVEIAGVRQATPIGLDNCEGVRIVEGPVVGCFLDANGKRRCATFGTGTRISQDRLPTAASGVGAMVLAFWHELKGATGVGMPEVRAPGHLPGMPYDLVLGNGKVLPFDLARTEVANIAAFEVRRNDAKGRTIIAIDSPPSTVEIPLNKLPRGARFAWRIAGEVGDYRGSFTLTDRAQLQRVRSKLMKIDGDKSLGPNERTLLVADLLYRNELLYDARATLRAAGFELN